MKFTEIKISGLKEGQHAFQFDLDSRFLGDFSKDIFDNPVVSVEITIHLTETMIRAELSISGNVRLFCDRSGDAFQFPLDKKVTYFLKFGEKEEEINDEICTILKESTSIQFDQLVYDTIALSVPLKKLHPRFLETETSDNEEGILVFSSSDDEKPEPEKNLGVDPRWQKLKELITK